MARLQALLLGLSRPERRDILLEISEIAMEYGDRQSIRKIIADIRENGLDALEADEISSARLLSLEADLAETFEEAATLNARAAEKLRRAMRTDSRRTTALALVECLRLLGTDYQRLSLWEKGRQALVEAEQVARDLEISEFPSTFAARVELAYHSALQFGNIGHALEALRALLDEALLHGWLAVTAEIGAMILHLSTTRAHYSEAVAWYDWLSGMGLRRLPEWQRDIMLHEGIHAMTMTGHPERAISILESAHEYGHRFLGAITVRYAEALEARGDFAFAIKVGVDALKESEKVRFLTGVAQSKRVLAACYHALGQERKARANLADSLELCEASETPYELLRTMVSASVVLSDAKLRTESLNLAQLLLESGGSHAFPPPPRQAEP
ncbi:MAG: hypothetical protein WB810_13770 [Candidatus Cybelea sp.]